MLSKITIIFIFICILISIIYLFNKYNNTTDINLNNFYIAYINLDTSKERNNFMIKQAKKFNLNINRIKAFDGKKLNLNNYNYFLKNLKKHFEEKNNRLGHLGCFLSHLKLYKEFLKTNLEYAIILEDDCKINNNNFKKIILDSIKKLPNNWDILLGGYHIDEDWAKQHKYFNKDIYLKNKILYNIKAFTGTHFYIINRKSAQKLLKLLEQPTWYIDWEISKYANEDKLKIYGIYPPIVCQPAAHKIKIKNINYNYNNKCSYKDIEFVTKSTTNS